MRVTDTETLLVDPRTVFTYRRAGCAMLVGVVLCLWLPGCGGRGRFGATVTDVAGTAGIRRAGEEQWRELEQSHTVEFGDSVRTRRESQLEIAFGAANTIRLDENTQICVADTVDSADRPIIEVYNAFGTVLSDIENLEGRHSRYRVRTPTSVAAVQREPSQKHDCGLHRNLP